MSGTTLYVKSWDAIEVIDISNPSAAIPRGRYDFVFDFQFELGPIVSSDGLLFLGVLKLAGPSENELWIFDVSDPDHPTPASISEMPGWDVRDIGVVGDFVYLALDWNGIVVLDVARPESPTILGVYELPLLAGIPNQISVRDGLAVVAVANGSDDSASLVFLNITDPAHPVVRGGQFEGRDARALSLMDGRACLLLDSSQLVILDLDRPYTCPAPRQSSDRLIPRASRRLKFEGVVQRDEE